MSRFHSNPILNVLKNVKTLENLNFYKLLNNTIKVDA
jgi:hypothetical protein